MCGYFYIGFIDFMLAGKTLTDYINLSSPYDSKKNDNIIFFLFQKWIKVILSNWQIDNWQNRLTWTNKISVRWNK